MKVEIRVTVDNNGQATVQYGNMSALDASLILSQIIVQLQANTIQQNGGKLIATPAGMPGGIRLS